MAIPVQVQDKALERAGPVEACLQPECEGKEVTMVRSGVTEGQTCTSWSPALDLKVGAQKEQDQ